MHDKILSMVFKEPCFFIELCLNIAYYQFHMLEENLDSLFYLMTCSNMPHSPKISFERILTWYSCLGARIMFYLSFDGLIFHTSQSLIIVVVWCFLHEMNHIFKVTYILLHTKDENINLTDILVTWFCK